MKNLILSSALVLGLAVSAAPITSNNLIESTSYEVAFNVEVSTFCKLITQGEFEAVQSMIKAGTDINKKSIGMTPLMYAARYNRVEIVKLLIANEADLKIKSNKGYTALRYAKISKAHETYKVISEAIDAKKKQKKRRK